MEELGRAKSVKVQKENTIIVDGLGNKEEIANRIGQIKGCLLYTSTKDLGVPTAGFDGDQADPRNFNAAQYETRVQGLVEAMEANMQEKEAK